MGCRRCDIEQRGHGIQAGTGGSHTWEQPTQPQIKDRMLARRAERNQMSDTRIRADILFEAVDLPKEEFDKLKARIGEIADEYKATVTINGRMYPGVEREQPEQQPDAVAPEEALIGPNSGPGWYEVINPRNATTNIAYVHEDGSLHLPEGDDLTPDEFAFAAARGNAHRLVRADDPDPQR